MRCIKVEHLAEPVRVATSMIGTHIPLHLLVIMEMIAMLVMFLLVLVKVLLRLVLCPIISWFCYFDICLLPERIQQTTQ